MPRDLIKEGFYAAKARQWVLGTSGTGKEQLGIACEIALDGGGTLTRTWYGYFTENTQDSTLEVMEIVGLSVDDLANGEGTLDADISVKVQHKENDKGEWFDEVRFINRPGGGGVAMKNRLSPVDAAKFSERLKGRALALGAGKAPAAGKAPPKKPAAKSGHPNAPGNNDDIPF
jgi:hypothetical protein